MDTVQVDVIVVGSGLAGVSAALEASRAGARVALLTSGTLCEGSSFSPRTWGLGMVTPLDPAAERRRAPESLAYAMESVGAHQNKPELVDALMEDASPAVDFLVSLGATVTEPTDPTQREFVPCFDTRVRGWHGFHAWDSREAIACAVRSDAKVQVLERTCALSLLQQGDGGSPVAGLVVASCEGSAQRGAEELVRFEAPAVVLATGGLAGVYERSFGGAGYLAAAMARDAGADFVNLEFLQLMMGFVSHPYGTICNEKLWRHASVVDEHGSSVFSHVGLTPEEERAALEAHSWHGPFTTARESRMLEQAVQAVEAAGHHAYLRLSDEFLEGAHPEFVDTYLDWLRQKGVDPRDPVQISLFAHSSNGGIAIDAHGATNVPGLFAAGECAGGVHGADRIGGLASVTALVFGRRAGVAAADHALRHRGCGGPTRLATSYLPVADGSHVERVVDTLMGRHCLVGRTEEGLRAALRALDDLARSCFGPARPLDEGISPRVARQSYAARGKLRAARMMVEAMLRRTASLGSHHRADG